MHVQLIFFCVFVANYQQLAAEFKVKFAETSAKANIGVEEAFMTMARAIKEKMDKV